MDTMIKNDKSSLSTSLENEQLLMTQKPPGVKCDIVNECQMFLKAEDGGGDAHLKITDNIALKIDDEKGIVTPTTSKIQEEPYENLIEDTKNDSASEVNEEMPSTVTVLDTPDGGKVYLVGTAHFSIKSQEDVSRVIQEVSPHIVMVELCEQRTNILLLDEEIILREAKNINIKKIRATMAQNGVFNGLMYILLLNMSAHITRELGMAPGGEFRRAMAEFIIIENKETNCGCSIDRAQKDNYDRKLFYDILQSEEGECLIGNELDENDVYKVTNDMVLIPGKEYYIGTDDVIIKNDMEGPERIVKLESFYVDKYEVSNRDFSHFTKLTNYKTEAETFGDSFVFALFLNNTFREKMKDFRVLQAPWWYKISETDWKHPYGPDSDILDVMDHPVIHVSWNDARTYCNWRRARLPSEAEWEVACRGGHRATKYPWGDKLFPDKKHMANIWQGTFPHHNSEKDGYTGTNPVHLFAQNDFGLHNMAGNVWEWTEDSWSSDNPNEKVKKGGSYLCHRSYCYRYRCSARSHNTVDSSAGNLGFRCAKST